MPAFAFARIPLDLASTFRLGCLCRFDGTFYVTVTVTVRLIATRNREYTRKYGQYDIDALLWICEMCET